MTSYKELGLVNTREMFKKAVDGGYAIPAFNFNTLEQMQAIVQAAVETKSPVIMQVSKGARNYAVLWNMPRNWDAPILRLFCIWIMETPSNFARIVSTMVSPV